MSDTVRDVAKSLEGHGGIMVPVVEQLVDKTSVQKIVRQALERISADRRLRQQRRDELRGNGTRLPRRGVGQNPEPEPQDASSPFAGEGRHMIEQGEKKSSTLLPSEVRRITGISRSFSSSLMARHIVYLSMTSMATSLMMMWGRTSPKRAVNLLDRASQGVVADFGIPRPPSASKADRIPDTNTSDPPPCVTKAESYGVRSGRHRTGQSRGSGQRHSRPCLRSLLQIGRHVRQRCEVHRSAQRSPRTSRRRQLKPGLPTCLHR